MVSEGGITWVNVHRRSSNALLVILERMFEGMRETNLGILDLHATVGAAVLSQSNLSFQAYTEVQ